MTHRTTSAIGHRPDGHHDDLGLSLLELLFVVMLAGILASIVVYSVSGMTASASGSSCGIERRTVLTATEAYFNETASSTVPATGAGHDRFERTLVEGGFLRSTSDLFDLDTDGNLIPEGDAPC